jgi:hypothetical protein
VVFTKRLRDGVRQGKITCSIRIWQYPHVTPGKRYRMEEGEIEVDSILPISLADITPELARESGFKSVVDLLKVAKHGPGENVYLIRFHFIPAAMANRESTAAQRRTSTKRPAGRRWDGRVMRGVLSNKGMKLTKLVAAPERAYKVPPRAFRRFAAARTASQLIPGVRQTL